MKTGRDELKVEELVAAARVVVEIWRDPHLYDNAEMNDAMRTLAGLLPVERDGRDWTPKEGDAF